jgi:hypothetical protein
MFTKALECFKTEKGKMIVLWVLLPRYLFDKCCTDPLHVSNKAEDGYEQAMWDILEDMATWMTSMAEMRRLKNVTIYNPMEPLGLLDDEADEEHILQPWDTDRSTPLMWPTRQLQPISWTPSSPWLQRPDSRRPRRPRRRPNLPTSHPSEHPNLRRPGQRQPRRQRTWLWRPWWPRDAGRLLAAKSILLLLF